MNTKDCNHSKVSSPNSESFESKDSDLDESTNEISERFDTKLCNDSIVSSRKFESSESKDSEHGSLADRILKVSNGNFESFDIEDCKDFEVSIENFENSESKVLKIDGRSKPRS
jgi:hypothetical protein